MRRPLAVTGLIFILLTFIVQLLIPQKHEVYTEYDNQICSVSGTLIRKEYSATGDNKTLVFYIDDIKQCTFVSDDISVDNIEKIICYMDKVFADIPIGSEVSVSGKLSSYHAATSPGMFDSNKYYESLGVSFCLKNAEITDSNSDNCQKIKWEILNKLCTFKDYISELCDVSFKEKDAGIIKSILLGERSSIDSETKELYSLSGISHILAISGLHIAFIGASIQYILRKIRIPNLINIPLSIAVIILYGEMCGMPASAFRAILMFSLKLIGPLLKRTYDSLTALTIAALFLLISNPRTLFNSGFLFSFAAVLSLSTVYPVLKDIFNSKISASISISVLTLPIQLYNYYYVPLLSVFMNIVVLPLTSILLVCAILTLIISSCNLWFSLPFSYITHIILFIFEKLCMICTQMPFLRLITGQPSKMQILVYLILIILIILFNGYQTPFQLKLNLLFAILLLSTNLRFGTEISLIDVGQGDGIYITDNAGNNILIDGGSSTISNVGKNRITPFLSSKGVAELDAVFITHLDADHYNGIMELMDQDNRNVPQIKNIIISKQTSLSDTEEYRTLIAVASNRNIPVNVMCPDDKYIANNFTLTCLLPKSDSSYSDTNEASLVLMFESKNTRILFTGDLEGEGEKELLEYLSCNFDNYGDYNTILKVAHHGSRNSTSDELLDMLQPDLAVISAGYRNTYGHPHQELLNRLSAHQIPYFMTIENGALTIKIRKNTVSLDGYVKN